MKTIVEIIFGSHLYGTATEKSDLDIKGIYVPSAKDILLQRIKPVIIEKRSKVHGEKNRPEDIDYELYSPEKYLLCLAKGQSFALEMLFAPDWAIMSNPDFLWYEIKEIAPKLLTKQVASFVNFFYSSKTLRLLFLMSDCRFFSCIRFSFSFLGTFVFIRFLGASNAF